MISCKQRRGDWSSRQRFAQACTALSSLLHFCTIVNCNAALHTCLFKCTVAPHSSVLRWKIAQLYLFSCYTANTFAFQFCTGKLHTFQTLLHSSFKILNNIAQSIASLPVQHIYARKRYSPCGPVVLLYSLYKSLHCTKY